MEIFHTLFENVWNEEEVPSDWKEGFIVKLPKKGDLSQCKNRRGIMLLSTPGKIFTRIILDRIQTNLQYSNGLQGGQIMQRSNCSTKNYRGAITRVEIIIVHQLHRLRGMIAWTETPFAVLENYETL